MTPLQMFVRQYVTTAIWASHGEVNGTEVQLDGADYGEDKLDPATRAEMEAEAAAFYILHQSLIQRPGACLRPSSEALAAGYDLDVATAAAAGHYFWLNRNGHGVGFWDSSEWEESAGTLLDLAATAAGERDLYIGDDGLIYQCPA